MSLSFPGGGLVAGVYPAWRVCSVPPPCTQCAVMNHRPHRPRHAAQPHRVVAHRPGDRHHAGHRGPNCINVILGERAKMMRPPASPTTTSSACCSVPSRRSTGRRATWRGRSPRTPRHRRRAGGARRGQHQLPAWEGGGSSTRVKPYGVAREPVGTQSYFARGTSWRRWGELLAGRGFREEDSPVAVISKALADDLFPTGTPWGGPSRGQPPHRRGRGAGDRRRDHGDVL